MTRRLHDYSTINVNRKIDRSVANGFSNFLNDTFDSDVIDLVRLNDRESHNISVYFVIFGALYPSGNVSI
jgi:hypothetical protein